MRLNHALKAAAERLEKAGVDDPRREASSIVTLVLGKPTAFHIAHPEYQLTKREQQRFADVLARREKREPLQYIRGHQEFWGMDFRLAPGILIPRPETEILVEAAIKHLKNVKDPRFVEAGVGSGCISISILGTIPESRAIATDISTIALEVARKNAEAHNVLDRLDLRQMDLLGGVHGRYDAVISNPPYIPNAEIEQLQPEVRDYEPHTALSGGPDGLDIVRRLVNDSRHILRSGGVLIMETGAGQATAVADLFDSLIWGKPDFINDLQAIPRVVIAARR